MNFLSASAILSHLGVIEPGDHFSDVKGDDPEASIDGGRQLHAPATI